MFYEYTLLVPPNTPKISPTVVEALVEPGILTYAELSFPPGPHQLVHVAVVEGAFQIIPRNRESDVAADDYDVPTRPNYPLKRGHNLLKLKGWSPGTTYQHEIKIRLTVMPEEEADPLAIVRDFVSVLKRLLGV